MSKIQDELKNKGSGSETNYSAHIDIQKCVGHILDCIKAVPAQVENACADGARHESIPGKVKTVVSFSINFVSQWLMSNDVFPSASHHIMVHLQEIGNEDQDTMSHVMRYQFSDEEAVKEKINIKLPIYDLTDCK